MQFPMKEDGVHLSVCYNADYGKASDSSMPFEMFEGRSLRSFQGKELRVAKTTKFYCAKD